MKTAATAAPIDMGANPIIRDLPVCWNWNTERTSGNKESAHSEKNEVEQPKFEEALTDNADGNLEPSLCKEGVETRQAEPKSKDKVKE